jgi:uncharacterized protein
MKCPNCNGVDLVMSERQGVEIDYCPNCRGIWLDRGELDKILDKAIKSESVQNEQSNQSFQRHDKYDDDYRREKYHRKKHWLNDLFD